MSRKSPSNISIDDRFSTLQQQVAPFSINSLSNSPSLRRSQKLSGSMQSIYLTPNSKTRLPNMVKFIGDSLRESSVPETQVESKALQKLFSTYLQGGSSVHELLQEMAYQLQGRQDQVEALGVHCDEIKLMRLNQFATKSIQVDYALLKAKSSSESVARDMLQAINRKSKSRTDQIQSMLDYVRCFKEKHQAARTVVFDSVQQSGHFRANLEKDADYLMQELKEEQSRNRKEIKQAQQAISNFRVVIREKEENLKVLKAKACTLSMRLVPGFQTRLKKQAQVLHYKIFQEFPTAKQIFVGNRSLKDLSIEQLDQFEFSNQLEKIQFYYDKKFFSFRCLYEKGQGMLHIGQTVVDPHKLSSFQKAEITMAQILSLIFYMQGTIVGVQGRLRASYGSHCISAGICQSGFVRETVTLTNKRLLMVSSYWNKTFLIGIGFWFVNTSNRSQPRSFETLPDD